jgi:PAS domain S-box-containing protein
MVQKPGKILLVDDDDIALHAISHLLRKSGFVVVPARSGAECVAKAGEEHPDLILLDIKLPDLSGLEVLKRLRAEPRFDHIFIVHLSAHFGSVERDWARSEHGADGYIRQPLENRELVARVQAYLRHKQTMDALRESESRYRPLFESNLDPMWIYEMDSLQIVAVNKAAIRSYGYTEAEFLSMKASDLSIHHTHPGSTSRTDERRRGSFARKIKAGDVCEVETKEQDISWMGKAARVVLAHEFIEGDRVELMTVQRELARKEGDLERLNRLNAAFLRMASHDLRKPISGILMAANLLLDSETANTVETQRLVASIKDAGGQMIKRLNHILDIAQIETGTLRLEKRPSDLASFISGRLFHYKRHAETKGILFQSELGCDLPAMMVDPGRVEQIVDTLLENALKFTPAGGRVTLRLERTANSVILSVQDTGTGMSETQRASLFSPLTAAGPTTYFDGNAGGMSLRIVKALVEQHHASITVKSRSGEGTTVTVTFQLPSESRVNHRDSEASVTANKS